MKGEIWSNGGGTQSAAIAALIIRGELPKPDAAVIADTGREASATWRFFDEIIHPELKKVGVDVMRLPHAFHGKGWNTVDIWSGREKNTIVMPMFSTPVPGKKRRGMLRKFCSSEWKTYPVQRYARSLGVTHGLLWIGFSTDEVNRMRSYDPEKKWNHHYPLVELGMDRADCIALVEDMGWGTPPRSSCWMCPYRTDQEWLHLKQTDPEDFRQAVELEKELQQRDPDAFFHESLKPLDQVSFNEEQGDLFDRPCASGMCFT